MTVHYSSSASDTQEIAASIAMRLVPGAVVALHGPLGSGKTTFVKGMAAALGIREVVTSPSFSLVQEYTKGSVPLYHVDLYRVQGPAEAELLDLAAYLHGNGITVVEWAERGDELLPPHTLHIHVAVHEDLRREIVEHPGNPDPEEAPS